MDTFVKKNFFIILLLSFSFLYAESITEAFGISYGTPYENAVIELQKCGYSILNVEEKNDVNGAKKIIQVGSFEYDGMPYICASFIFTKKRYDNDYSFDMCTTIVDTDKINSDMRCAAMFQVFCETIRKKYSISTDSSGDPIVTTCRGNNGGLIIFYASDDTLQIVFIPKEPMS